MWRIPIVFLFTGSFLISNFVHADSVNGMSLELRDVFKLQEALPEAVCDEGTVSKVPTLAATPETMEWAQSKKVRPRKRMFLNLKEVSEGDIISFMMGDAQTLIGSAELNRAWAVQRKIKRTPEEAAGSLRELRRRVALSVCTSVVVPGRLPKLVARSPAILMKLHSRIGKGKSGAWFAVRDVEDRFGLIEGKWWAAGWIESYELEYIQYKTRRYYRVAHPVTNQIRLIMISDLQGFPVGYLYPVIQEPSMDWLSLDTRAKSPAHQKKKVETYRSMIEADAYRALEENAKNAGKIRNLQEFYKNLIKAYEIYPDDQRFAFYRKGGARLPRPHSLLTKGFFTSLRQARMNGSFIGVALFEPDQRLHGIYSEYKHRLANK